MEREFLYIEESDGPNLTTKLAEASAIAGRDDFRVDGYAVVIKAPAVNLNPTHCAIASWAKGGWTH